VVTDIAVLVLFRELDDTFLTYSSGEDDAADGVANNLEDRRGWIGFWRCNCDCSAVLTCNLCRQLGSELEKMVKVQLCFLLVHRVVCDQRVRGIWVLLVIVLVPGLAPDVGVEQPMKSWFDATKAVSDA
jgi:hypothetical protein